jgi:hypothetical protein
MPSGTPAGAESQTGLSSEKREDIWALLIALTVLVLCLAAPESIYTFFKKTIFIF